MFQPCVTVPGTPCPPQPTSSVNRTEPAFDLGGVIELYPSRRVVVRVDAGDTIIRFNRNGVGDLISHNFQLSTGVGFRF